MTPSAEFWRNRRVLVTGHTGFKGGWLSLWLQALGAKVTGIALPPETTPSLCTAADVEQGMASHRLDLADLPALRTAVQEAAPEIVFHLAAQALVRQGYRTPVTTFATNVLGTAHVLECLRFVPSTRVVVCVTTDKVYQPRSERRPYREADPLGGHDPYSASKAACEHVIASFRTSYLAAQGVAVASVRAGNVVGGGDWSADRLLPDAMRAWGDGRPLTVRQPDAIRPWQHVLEPLSGYLKLAEAFWHDGQLPTAWNFGPPQAAAAPVRTVIEYARQAYGDGMVVYEPVATGPAEASWLALDADLAATRLGWNAKWSLAESIRRTVAWHVAFQRGAAARTLCMDDIAAYVAADLPAHD